MEFRKLFDFEEDPERKLWVMGRRKFLFLGSMFAASTALPNIAVPTGENVVIPSPTWVTKEVARYFVNEIKFVANVNRTYDGPLFVSPRRRRKRR